MTRDEMTSALVKADAWLNGHGARLPGAAAAKQGIANLAGPHRHGEFRPAEGPTELIEMIASEGEFRRDPSVSIDQHRENLRAAATAAIGHALQPSP
jgi:hypothetical protein